MLKFLTLQEYYTGFTPYNNFPIVEERTTYYKGG